MSAKPSVVEALLQSIASSTQRLPFDKRSEQLRNIMMWEERCGERRVIHKLSEPLRIRWRAHRRWREEGRWLELEEERVRAVLLSDDWDAPGKIAEARTRPAKLPEAKIR